MMKPSQDVEKAREQIGRLIGTLLRESSRRVILSG
jgi:hypothetical protein